jgi:hypothetical protein
MPLKNDSTYDLLPALMCSLDWYYFYQSSQVWWLRGHRFLSRVGSLCLTLLGRFGGARRRRERQARSDVLSLWVTYLPQRSSSVALRALFSFARVDSQRRTLLSLVGGAHLRHEKQARSDLLFQLMPTISSGRGPRWEGKTA